jgi:hypothetical protein
MFHKTKDSAVLPYKPKDIGDIVDYANQLFDFALKRTFPTFISSQVNIITIRFRQSGDFLLLFYDEYTKLLFE